MVGVGMDCLGRSNKKRASFQNPFFILNSEDISLVEELFVSAFRELAGVELGARRVLAQHRCGVRQSLSACLVMVLRQYVGCAGQLGLRILKDAQAY